MQQRHTAKTMVALSIIAMLMLAGCTTVKSGGEGRIATYVGIVRVKQPAMQDGVQAVSVKSLGLGWDGGPIAGFNVSQRISVDPEKCQITVIIQNKQQAEKIRDILSNLQGEKLCAI